MKGTELHILNAESSDYSREAATILHSLGVVSMEELNQHDLMQRIADADVLIVRLGLQINESLLKAASRLKVVVSATTGTDHIDLDAAARHQVAVLTLKGESKFLESIPSTTEHTWALLLSLVRRLPWAFEHVKKGGWDRQAFRGHNLMGKRLGILGLGRVGRQVAQVARAFRMKVLAYDKYAPDYPAQVSGMASMEALMSESDILSIHVPLSEESERLLDKSLLKKLPKGAVVINTSRGGIWDEQAVVDLLQSGHLAGVATDVVTDEQSPGSQAANPLIRYAQAHENVIVTPHIAGATHESMAMTEIFMARKLERFIKEHNLLKV